MIVGEGWVRKEGFRGAYRRAWEQDGEEAAAPWRAVVVGWSRRAVGVLEQRGEGLGELSGVAHAAGPESPACAHATALGPFKECFFF